MKYYEYYILSCSNLNNTCCNRYVQLIFGWGNIMSITGAIFGYLLLGGIMNNVVSDLLWAKSIVLTSPTV